MDSLPPEMLGIILYWDVRMCRCEKNAVLPHRLVCKAFDNALKPFIFKTVQLEFSRFLKTDRTPTIESLERVGGICEALYLDMMVVRDEEEIQRLSNVFQGLIPQVPEMVPLLASLRRYCLNETTFEGAHYSQVLQNVLTSTPNMNRVKLNLPFQVVGQRARSATVLLANTLKCLANRDEDHKPLQTLVVDHVSDTTLIDICNNHIDLGYAFKVFSTIKSLVISIKRQEAQPNRQESFNRHLWMLIRKAVGLQSLCLVGWNVKRDIVTRRHQHGVSQNVWNMRSLPITGGPSNKFKHLRFLELKRVDVSPASLLSLFQETAETLKEVFLNEVYLKIQSTPGSVNSGLWIGHPDVTQPETACWVAEEIRQIDGLKLDVLRATGLGYDDFDPNHRSPHPHYDLLDPMGWDRSFDQRFVDAVVLGPDSSLPTYKQPSHPFPEDLPQYINPLAVHIHTDATTGLPQPTTRPNPRKRKDYDAEAYQRQRNSTSEFKRCIDGYFFNHNEQALQELQQIITVADRGMTLLSADIERARAEDIPAITGNQA